jgi:hypothetical protein
MATIKSVVVEDDIDGTPGAATVRFAFEGINYEIDLTEGNAAKFAEVVTPFVQAARKAGTRKSTAAPSTNKSRADRAAARAWAQKSGFPVGQRGRIPATVLEAYEAAHSHAA